MSAGERVFIILRSSLGFHSMCFLATIEFFFPLVSQNLQTSERCGGKLVLGCGSNVVDHIYNVRGMKKTDYSFHVVSRKWLWLHSTTVCIKNKTFISSLYYPLLI